MSKTDQTSGSRPLRKRKSKRFDRTGETPRVGSSAPDVDVDSQVDGSAESTADADVATATAVIDKADLETGVTAGAGGADDLEPAGSGDATETADDADGDGTRAAAQPMTRRAPMLTQEPTRSRTLGERDTCGRCGHEVSMVDIEVDSTVLVMESCDNCDTRRWHLSGEQIDLQQALDHVGEHAGRRR